MTTDPPNRPLLDPDEAEWVMTNLYALYVDPRDNVLIFEGGPMSGVVGPWYESTQCLMRNDGAPESLIKKVISMDPRSAVTP